MVKDCPQYLQKVPNHKLEIGVGLLKRGR